MDIDIKIEVMDDGEVKRVQSELSILHNAALRELHKGSVVRTDGVLGVDLRAINKRPVESLSAALGERLVSGILISKLVKAAG